MDCKRYTLDYNKITILSYCWVYKITTVTSWSVSVNPTKLWPDQETDLIANIVELVQRGHTGWTDNSRSESMVQHQQLFQSVNLCQPAVIFIARLRIWSSSTATTLLYCAADSTQLPQNFVYWNSLFQKFKQPLPPTLVSEVACQISSKLLLLPKSNRLEYLSDKVYESNDDNFQFQPVIQFQFIFISCLVSNKAGDYILLGFWIVFQPAISTKNNLPHMCQTKMLPLPP